jgi:cytochrome c biogenesis protein CcmG/thiol:disulfide interchange protein DsbE
MHGMGRRLVLAFSALAVLLPACTSAPSSSSGSSFGAVPSSTGSSAVNAADASLLPSTVDQLPEMDVAGFDELRAQLRGTPLVVNLWASWCEPCQAEGPDLSAAAERYGDRIQFLGVDVQDNRDDAVSRFIHRFGLSYPSVFDVPGAIMSDLGIVGPPATFFYRADGSLLRSIPSQISREDLDRAIRDLLA